MLCNYDTTNVYRIIAKQHSYKWEGVLCEMRTAECRNLKRCILQNFTCETFRKLHLSFYSDFAFSKIQIKSNNQFHVGLR